MTKINITRFEEIILGFKNKRILVLGDLMLDKYLWGQVNRISPEAPVPIVAVNRDTSSLGGAGNVANNLYGMGALPLLTGVVGQDPAGEWIRKQIPDNRGILSISDRPTTVKTRIIAHQQQVVRVDQEYQHLISAQEENQIINFIRQEHYQGIIISDYNKGMVTRLLMENILDHAQSQSIPIFVDPKVENIAFFSPVMLLTPNHFEAEKIANHPCNTNEEVERAGENIFSRISTKYVILKRGEQGMTILEKNKKAVHFPTKAREIYDVTGAGDTVIAAASLALLSGATIQEAARLANTAAGIVISKIGTASLSAEELLSALKSQNR